MTELTETAMTRITMVSECIHYLHEHGDLQGGNTKIRQMRLHFPFWQIAHFGKEAGEEAKRCKVVIELLSRERKGEEGMTQSKLPLNC